MLCLLVLSWLMLCRTYFCSIELRSDTFSICWENRRHTGIDHCSKNKVAYSWDLSMMRPFDCRSPSKEVEP